MKFINLIAIFLYSSVILASSTSTFSEIEKLKKKISKLKKEQIHMEVLRIKKIETNESRVLIYDKKKNTKELQSLSNVSTVLKLIPEKEDIKCDSL